MCLDCGKKACEIDGRCPHFIDRYHGTINGEGHGEVMPDAVYVPATSELWAYMEAKHGRIVKL